MSTSISNIFKSLPGVSSSSSTYFLMSSTTLSKTSLISATDYLINAYSFFAVFVVPLMIDLS
jgi:hypothetical protein